MRGLDPDCFDQRQPRHQSAHPSLLQLASFPPPTRMLGSFSPHGHSIAYSTGVQQRGIVRVNWLEPPGEDT